MSASENAGRVSFSNSETVGPHEPVILAGKNTIAVDILYKLMQDRRTKEKKLLSNLEFFVVLFLESKSFQYQHFLNF